MLESGPDGSIIEPRTRQTAPIEGLLALAGQPGGTIRLAGHLARLFALRPLLAA
jgi:hypothetical protein